MVLATNKNVLTALLIYFVDFLLKLMEELIINISPWYTKKLLIFFYISFYLERQNPITYINYNFSHLSHLSTEVGMNSESLDVLSIMPF